LGECRSTIRENKESIENLTKENTNLQNSCKNLEKIRENLKKEAEWMLRQNKKLKGFMNADQCSDLFQNYTL